MAIYNYIHFLNLSKESFVDLRDLTLLDQKTQCVWVKQGHIQSVEGFFNKMKYAIHKEAYRKEVAHHISSLVLEIEKKDPVFIRLNREALQKIFLSTLAPLDEESFPRSAIQKGGTLESLLGKAFLWYDQGQIDPLTGKNFDDTLEEAKFALRLGVKPTLARSGSSGTYFIKDRFGHSLGIFKPVDEGPHGVNNPRWIYQYFKKHLRPFNHRHGIVPTELHLAETASSRMSRELDFAIAPFTEIVELESSTFSGKTKKKEGSFQLFVKGKEAEKVMGSLSYLAYLPRILATALIDRFDQLKNRLESITPSNFEDLALFDILSLNNDRKFDNWFITAEGKAIAIDNANGFPTKLFRGYHSLNPLKVLKNYLDVRNLLLWEILPRAKKPFSEEAKQRILSLTAEQCLHPLETLDAKITSSKQRKHMYLRRASLTVRLNLLQSLVLEDKPIREICRIMKDADLMVSEMKQRVENLAQKKPPFDKSKSGKK